MEKDKIYEFILHIGHHLRQDSSYIDGCLTLMLSDGDSNLSELHKSLLALAQNKITDIQRLENEIYEFLSRLSQEN